MTSEADTQMPSNGIKRHPTHARQHFPEYIINIQEHIYKDIRIEKSAITIAEEYIFK